MAARAGLSPDAVVSAALAVVDETGAEALTLARVASRTGVATPSLYAHVAGLPALRRLITIRVTAEVADLTRRAVAGLSGEAAVRAAGTVYRTYFRDHPHRLPFLATALDPDDREGQAAARDLLDVIFAGLRAYNLDDGDLVHATRCLRAALHGFAALEAASGFKMPYDLDESFRHLLDMLVAGLTALAEGD